ncbi:MAG: DUF3078 domain-containing protein [Rhodothermales bacterium]|nr:DUF3078 domain-containing protein [Rhodothermales bacterium]MBO6780703.1 DUF3078 domain-containing protein [Rhodothermales bacterium]
MRATLILLAAFLTAPVTLAQDADTTETPTWTRSLIGRVSGAQAGFSNWAEGGVNTLAATVGAEGSAEKVVGTWHQKHTMRLTFGVVRQDTLEVRKAEDLIRFRSNFQYAGGVGFLGTFQPTVAAGFRSQFAPGKNFEKDPFEEGRTPPVKVSDFFSPATFTQTVGLTYVPSSWFTQRFGLAAKETVVMIERLRPLYGVDPDKSMRTEIGLEAFSEIDRKLAENVHYTSTLGLFAAFGSEDAPDLIWENAVAMKVNDFLNVNVEWTLLYDRDVTDDLQAKEVISVGLSYIFL